MADTSTNTAKADTDLGAELDALFEEIREQEPDLVTQALNSAAMMELPGQEPAEPPPAAEPRTEPAAGDEPSTAEDDELSSQIDQMLAEATSATAADTSPSEQVQPTDDPSAANTPAEDVLEDQIQGLLDDVAGEVASMDSDPPPAQPQADDAGESAAAAETEARDRRATDKQSESEQPQAAPESVEALDDLLADQADDAMAGDFETVQDVLEADAKQAPADETAGPPAPGDDGDAPAAAATTNEEDDDLLAGDFATAEEVINQEQADASASPPPAATPDQATAADELQAEQEQVARELDEHEAATDTIPERIEEEPTRPGRSRRLVPVVVAQIAYKTCRTMNLPVKPLPAGVRSIVGWAGLITLFNGAIYFAVGVVRSLLL